MKPLVLLALLLTSALASGAPREFQTVFKWGDGAKRSTPYVTTGPYELKWQSKSEEFQSTWIAIQIFDDPTGSKVTSVIGRLESGKVHVPVGGRHRLTAFFGGEPLTFQVDEAPAPSQPQASELPEPFAGLAKRAAELKAESAKLQKELKRAPTDAKAPLIQRAAQLKLAEENLAAECDKAAKKEAGTLILDGPDSEIMKEIYRSAIDIRSGGLPAGVQTARGNAVPLPPGMRKK